MFSVDAASGKELIYFPYWRLKGMLFSVSPQGLEHRFIDVSLQGSESSVLPISLGLRSQALKLKFVSSDARGRFLAPRLPLSQVKKTLDTRFSLHLPKPILHQAQIGESLSLIYSPFYIQNGVYDGILNQLVSDSVPDGFDAGQVPGGRPGWNVRFIPTLCPNCGWDLQGERDSQVLACSNCASMWRGTAEGMRRVKFAILPSKSESAVYLPFWRIKAEVSGIALRSYADLVRAANLPRVIQPGWEEIEFRFWAPAFKVRPQTFLRLADHLTRFQPGGHLEADLPKGKIHPVNLPFTEAVESLKTIVAGFLRPRKALLEKLLEIRIGAMGRLLVFIPFVETLHELVQPEYRLAVNRNQLRLSGNL